MLITQKLATVGGTEPQVRQVWSRAAALGSLWAAFEIVVGSFLHNLRLPFAGTMLAAASVLLLTAAAQVWTERGLIWRAALVCALMKSVSPSAVLLGPMVGILMEGMILQVSLRLLGAGWPGCLIGGALAVSYTLLQKVVSLTILYGADLVRVYTATVQFASKVTGWEGLHPTTVLLMLLLVQAALGAFAGLTGWQMGRRVLRCPVPRAVPPVQAAPFKFTQTMGDFRHSLPMLAVGLMALPVGMWLIGRASLTVGGLLALPIVAGIFVRYGRSRGRLLNLRLWAELLLVVVLSSVMLGAAYGELGKGVIAGARMALRAVWLIALFTAIGAELSHPRLLRWLTSGRLASVYAAAQSAFCALPDFVANIPDLRSLVCRPVDTLARLFRQVDSWQRYLGAAHAFILTGERGAGKSTLCLALAERARQAGISVGGIVSISEGDTLPWQGYRVKNLLTGEERPLARRTDIQEGIRCGSYVFDPEGIRFGQQAIEQAVQAGVHLLVVDEVGLLELNGEGWAPALQQLPTTGVMLWVVRASVVEEIRRRYPPLAGATVMDAATMDAQALWERLYGRSIASTYAI